MAKTVGQMSGGKVKVKKVKTGKQVDLPVTVVNTRLKRFWRDAVG